MDSVDSFAAGVIGFTLGAAPLVARELLVHRLALRREERARQSAAELRRSDRQRLDALAIAGAASAESSKTSCEALDETWEETTEYLGQLIRDLDNV